MTGVVSSAAGIAWVYISWCVGIDNVHWRIREQVTCIGDDSRNLYEKESYRLLPTYASLSGRILPSAPQACYVDLPNLTTLVGIRGIHLTEQGTAFNKNKK
ncbi:hypothetical protein FCM35_KLT18617 [Carex littledalei]|uniref:Uncharacterized protein n=1 Tax=Carex littledalei TaxID=544730 RepID=A0A833QY43_9POAL|nr:hypothetical protein FCM35_KLT18617 [Carex littledalei]